MKKDFLITYQIDGLSLRRETVESSDIYVAGREFLRSLRRFRPKPKLLTFTIRGV